MEKIKIEVEGTPDLTAYVDDIGAVRTDKHIIYETESGHDGSVEAVTLTKVAEVTPRILLGEFPVAVEVVLEETEDGTQKILMLNLQDLLDKYNEEYDNAKA